MLALQFVIGWRMPDVHKDTQAVGLIAWHLSVGATLVAEVVSPITHFFLYVRLLLVALLGWINASPRGWTVRFAGAVAYPSLSKTESPFGDKMGDVHAILAWELFALIFLYKVAALFHRFLLQDLAADAAERWSIAVLDG
ncbi:cytochrome b [Caballeronia terrestris]|uniref:cytochrome b n=1 Tax=Caballeronia terrestris TaxID=1226301 RepID=UPI002E15E037|nr:cytochrome b/b6 domain-containing protein [Caballeronia terrestris]